MDAACFTVMILHRFLSEPGKFGDQYQAMEGYRRVIEAKLGHRVVLQDIKRGSPGAHQLERKLRRLIAADAEFGSQMLWVAQHQHPFTAEAAPLYYEDLLERDEVYTPFAWKRQHTVVAVVIAVVLVLGCVALGAQLL